MNKYATNDMIISVLANMPLGKRWFGYDEAKFKKFFFVRRKRYPIQGIFEFDNDWLFPDSRSIDDALWNMRVSRMLENLDFRTYKINASVSDAYDRFVKHRFDPKALEQIYCLSGEFAQKFNAQYTP